MDCPALLAGLTPQGCRLFSFSSTYWQNPVGETVHKRHQNGMEPAAAIAHGKLVQAELELMYDDGRKPQDGLAIQEGDDI